MVKQVLTNYNFFIGNDLKHTILSFTQNDKYNWFKVIHIRLATINAVLF